MHEDLVVSNNVFDNEFGVFAVLDGATFANNEITTNAATALTIADGSQGVEVRNNDLSGNLRGCGLQTLASLARSATIASPMSRFSKTIFRAIPRRGWWSWRIGIPGRSMPRPTGGVRPLRRMLSRNHNQRRIRRLHAVAQRRDRYHAATGFQGDFSSLTVDDNSPQNGSTERIREGLDLVATGGTVHVEAGTYATAGQVLIDRDVSVVGDSISKPVITPARPCPQARMPTARGFSSIVEPNST